MQKPLWHFDAEYMTASFIINCFLFLVLVFNQASIYDGAIESASNLLNPTFSMREDFQAAGIRISAFNRQEDKESTSLLLPTLEESNTSTELHYDIPTSNRPVTGIYEEIGQKIETSNILDAAREVCNRLNDLVDELELTNIVISSNDHTVPNNESALLGYDSTVIEMV